MAFKTFTAGAVLTAADLNDYLMEQANIACTSGTRPTGQEAMEIVETDTDRTLVHDGSAWQRMGWYSATGRTLVRARRVATQSIAASTATDISWDTEDSDTDGMVAAHATTGVTFTVQTAGLWVISFRGGFASTITGARAFVDCAVTAAATGVTGSWRSNMYGDSAGAISTGPIPLAASDTFKFTAFQASGGAVNFTGWMTAVRVGA